jgi:hypothetical protein
MRGEEAIRPEVGLPHKIEGNMRVAAASIRARTIARMMVRDNAAVNANVSVSVIDPVSHKRPSLV